MHWDFLQVVDWESNLKINIRRYMKHTECQKSCYTKADSVFRFIARNYDCETLVVVLLLQFGGKISLQMRCTVLVPFLKEGHRVTQEKDVI